MSSCEWGKMCLYYMYIYAYAKLKSKACLQLLWKVLLEMLHLNYESIFLDLEWPRMRNFPGHKVAIQWLWDRQMDISSEIYIDLKPEIPKEILSFCNLTAQQTWSGFSPTTVPDNNRQSGFSPTAVPKLSTGWCMSMTQVPLHSLIPTTLKVKWYQMGSWI